MLRLLSQMRMTGCWTSRSSCGATVGVLAIVGRPVVLQHTAVGVVGVCWGSCTWKWPFTG